MSLLISSIWVRCGLSCAVWQVGYLSLYTPLGSLLSPQKLKDEEARTWRIKLVNMAHALLVGPAAWLVLLFEPVSRSLLDAALRFDGPYLAAHAYEGGETALTGHLIAISVGFFLWDLLHFKDWESKDPIMAAHHVISILAWPLTVAYNRAAWFVLVNISSELSSPLLQARWLARTAVGKGAALFAAVSMAFALTFFASRTSIIPAVGHAYLAMKPWALCSSSTGVDLLLALITAVCVPIPQILNMIWSLEIVNSIRRTLTPAKKRR